MSSSKAVFTLGSGGEKKPSHNVDPFLQHGFSRNPFPASGVASDVLFRGHIPKQLQQIDDWLTESQATLNSYRPLALRGSLGVGKTHLLQTLERGLRGAGYAVVNRILSAKELGRLLLSDLLLPEATAEASAEGSESPSEWIVQMYRMAETEASLLEEHLVELPPGSSVAKIFRQVSDDPQRLRLEWVLRYFSRAYLTESQVNKLGVSSRMRGEGESLEALGDLARLAVSLGLIPGPWFIFLDQLEDLFRPGAVGAARKVRFLTDLRTLVDLALSGAPIAILVAWNTEIEAANTEQQLMDEYRALWSRLSEPVDLPKLRLNQLQEFAEAYLDHALKTDPRSLKHPSAGSSFRLQLLTSGFEHIRKRVLARDAGTTEKSVRLSLREALDYWRQAAVKLAEDLARK